MIADEAFEEIRADWDYSGGGTGSYWHMLKHAEAGGFDLAVMKHSIHGHLADSKFGAYYLLLYAERELVLELRDRMRAECLLAPLSPEQRQSWRWADIAPSRRYQYDGPQLIDETKRMTPAQNQAAASYLYDRYPEAVRYLRLVREHNAPLGFNGGPHDKYIVRQAWHKPFLEDAVCEIVGEQGDLFVRWHEIEWIVAPG